MQSQPDTRRSESVAVIARQREIIRLTVLGWSAVRIAAHLEMSVGGVRAVMRSPLVMAEIEKMQEAADQMTVNVPLRAAMEAELRGATVEAVRLRRRLMNDSSIGARVRAKIGEHFMDRMLFDRSAADDGQSSYREILRRLDEVDRALGQGVWLLPSVNPETEVGNSSAQPTSVEAQEEPMTGPPDALTEAIRRHIRSREPENGHSSIPPD